MHILKVQLLNFRFNSIHHKGPLNVTCYKLKDDDEEIEGACMDHGELTKLTNYIAANKENFGYSSYHNCDPEYCPEMTEYDLLPVKSIFPKYMIVRKLNKIDHRNSDVLNWMDIELLKDNGNSNSLFSLPFDLVCQVDQF